jgi:hypothetical protein
LAQISSSADPKKPDEKGDKKAKGKGKGEDAPKIKKATDYGLTAKNLKDYGIEW